MRQILVINDPVNPFEGQYDEEVVVTLSDWYHDQMPGLMSKFISVENPTGAEPVPQAALINDTQNVTVSVEPGKTYYFHMANIGAFAGQYFWIEGHTMKIIEVDGVFVDAAEAEMIYITAAQRYSFLVTTRNDSSANFAMVGAMDTVCRRECLCADSMLTCTSRCLTPFQSHSTRTSLDGLYTTKVHHCPQPLW